MNQFKQRRSALFDTLKDNEMICIFAGEPIRNSADNDYEFHSHRNYYYLTGLDEPQGVLLLIKSQGKQQERLFIRDINYDQEKWIGRFVSAKSAQTISEISQIYFVSAFKSTFEMLVNRGGIDSLYLDFDRQHFDTRPLESELFAQKVESQFKGLTIKNIHREICFLRTIKNDHEIAAIKEAAQITDQAINRALKAMRPGVNEYELMAHFLFELNLNNATEMFDTIMASGPNGPILHYVENNRQTQDGELVLFDLGAKKNHYGADISRTYPINGKYSERQKQLYNIVLEAQDRVTAAAKPGVTLLELNQVVIEFYAEKLQEIGLIASPSEVSKYYYHSVSHFLGLDTHDVGQLLDYKLVSGNVITNEPGLYIAEENIGIRIETDLLITETGCVDLAPQIKKTVADIEAFLAE